MSQPSGTPDSAPDWDERYSASEYIFGTQPNEYLVAQAHHIAPGSRVLCVADGEGRNGVWLAQQGHSVEAFDLSPVGVAKAQALARGARVQVQYRVSSCDGWDWKPAHYDAVVAVFVQFADPPMRERLFGAIADCLKPGGLVILQGYTPQQLQYKTGGPPLVSHLYTAQLLREAFADLEIVELREYEAELTEGTRHRGRSALVGMVARKTASGLHSGAVSLGLDRRN